MNSILAIHSYKHEGMWVFDDERAELAQEAFVEGADTIIDRMVESTQNASKGFTLIFSAGAFPNYDLELEWRREEFGGNWYYAPSLDMQGWLCPALFKYFDEAPKKLYAQFKKKRM